MRVHVHVSTSPLIRSPMRARLLLVLAQSAQLGRALSTRMLAAKAAVAQKAQARQAQARAQGDAESSRLNDLIDDEIAARQAVEGRLEKARLQQHNLAERLHATREAGNNKVNALTTLMDWKEAHAMQKREAWGDRIAPKHYCKGLLRMCIGRWRSASRKARHVRIDAFWENSIVELREALQGHYEPRLATANATIADLRAQLAAEKQAKHDLGVELKAAFMRNVCQLNLETASIIKSQPKDDAENPTPNQAPPRPIRPEDLLATARRGLQQAQARY